MYVQFEELLKGNYFANRLVYFILARHDIYLRRKALQPKPWTEDEILQSYRFCNVFRELDTVTIWIARNWRNVDPNAVDVWFAMVVARLFNWPPTLELIDYPVPFNAKRIMRPVNSLKQRGEKVFSGAYIVSTNGREMDKAEYLVTHVLAPLWKDRKKFSLSIANWRTRYNKRLELYHDALMQYNGMGSFMAAQVIADIKYDNTIVNDCDDWWTFAASGPGSRRGLNRVLGREYNAPWTEKVWRTQLEDLRSTVNSMLRDYSLWDPGKNKRVFLKLHAQDLQNCLCEFDKYERVRLGQGRPRSRYEGKPL